MAFSLACDAGKTTLRIEGEDNNVTWNDVANAGAGSVAVDGGGTEDPSFFVTEHIVNAVYQILKDIQFGDGSNALIFYSKNEMVFFDDDYKFEIKSNSTLRLGEISGSGAINGSFWSLGPSSNFTTLNIAGSYFYAYASKLHVRGDKVVRFFGNATLQDVILSYDLSTGTYRQWRFHVTTSLNNIYINNVAVALSLYTAPTMQNVRFGKVTYGIACFVDEVLTATGVEWSDVQTAVAYMYAAGSRLNLINPSTNLSQSDVRILSDDNSWVKEQYTCDIHVVDKDGSNLEGVTVTCEDKDSNQVFSVQTGADGKIAQQTITYKKWEGTAKTETEYSPHKFTFSKNGYTLLVMDNITVDARINWDIKVKFPERIRARMANMGRLAILR